MISYYELLGLIKEGKQPDKVKYENIIFTWEDAEYYSENSSSLTTMLEHDFASKGLIIYKEIEIIEEKPKEIEEIELNLENDIIYFGEDRVRYIGTNRKDRDVYIPKINELIDKVNYLLERDKHE